MGTLCILSDKEIITLKVFKYENTIIKYNTKNIKKLLAIFEKKENSITYLLACQETANFSREIQK
jgi:hypothetical protein